MVMADDSVMHIVQLLIVDEYPHSRRSLESDFAALPDIALVSAVASTDDALRLFDSHQLEVILLSLSIPALDMVKCIKQLLTAAERARQPIQIILYSSSRDPLLIALALEGGAVNYLHQSVDTPELIASIRSAAGRDGIKSPDAVSVYDDKLVRSYLDLSEAERDVLLLLMQGLSNKAIAAFRKTAVSTVKKHMSSIFAKLDVKTRAKALSAMMKNRLTDD